MTGRSARGWPRTCALCAGAWAPRCAPRWRPRRRGRTAACGCAGALLAGRGCGAGLCPSILPGRMCSPCWLRDFCWDGPTKCNPVTTAARASDMDRNTTLVTWSRALVAARWCCSPAGAVPCGQRPAPRAAAAAAAAGRARRRPAPRRSWPPARRPAPRRASRPRRPSRHARRCWRGPATTPGSRAPLRWLRALSAICARKAVRAVSACRVSSARSRPRAPACSSSVTGGAAGASGETCMSMQQRAASGQKHACRVRPAPPCAELVR